MSAVFEHSSTVVLFDYFRVPSRPADGPPARAPVTSGLLEAFSWIRSVDSGRLLLWPDDDLMTAAAPDPVTYQLRSMELYGRVLPDSTAVNLLGETWIRNDSIHDRKGHDLSSVWSDRDGNIFLPFDPNEAVTAFWQEAYSVRALLGTDRLTALSQAAYYYVRPVLPRNVQVRLRRLLRRVQEQLPFPRWPIEPSLHDLYAYLFGLCAEAAGGSRARDRAVARRPQVGARADPRRRDAERLPQRPPPAPPRTGRRLPVVLELRPPPVRVDDGSSASSSTRASRSGIHGLAPRRPRSESPLRSSRARLPLMREFAERWNAVGFRSPATQRVWELMPQLGFDYDSSYPDTDPYEPQPGGCCSWLPFFNDDLVELPITLPQDHTLFDDPPA